MKNSTKYIAVALFSVGGLLFAAGAANAQFLRHGGFGGHGHGWSHGHGHVTRVGHYLHDHVGYGGYHHYGHSNYYYPSIYSGYYATPVYVQSAIDYGVPVVTARTMEPVVVAPRQESASVAVVELTVPDPNARVWIEGVEMTSRGATRIFESPPLTAGKVSTYTIRAAWNVGDQVVQDERRVDVSASRTVAVDFTQPDRPIRERMPAPKQ